MNRFASPDNPYAGMEENRIAKPAQGMTNCKIWWLCAAVLAHLPLRTHSQVPADPPVWPYYFRYNPVKTLTMYYSSCAMSAFRWSILHNRKECC